MLKPGLLDVTHITAMSVEHDAPGQNMSGRRENVVGSQPAMSRLELQQDIPESSFRNQEHPETSFRIQDIPETGFRIFLKQDSILNPVSGIS
jgi:hypothetical protein